MKLLHILLAKELYVIKIIFRIHVELHIKKAMDAK
jgi:hypothetical protein